MYAMVQIDENSIVVSCYKSGEEDCVLFYNLTKKYFEHVFPHHN